MVEIEEYLSPECISSNDASAPNDNTSEDMEMEVSTIAPPTKAQRDAIMEDLVRLSDQYIEQMPEMALIHSDVTIGYESRYVKDESGHVTCTRYQVADFDIQLFKDMRQEELRHMSAMVNRVSARQIAEEEGNRSVALIRTQMPWPLSHRAMISTFYYTERDGAYYSIQSSRGNDYYYEQFAEDITGDQIADH